MKNYKTMTPEQSAYEISILTGRPVRYSRNIYADPDIEERHLKVYDRRGCAARICDNGSIVLYGKPEHNRYHHLLMTSVYQIVVEKGPAGLLPGADQMRMAAERSLRFADTMSDVDLRAFCMSCSDGNVIGTKTAADILHVAFKGAEYPEGLERAVCNGMKAYRFEILKNVREGSDEGLIKAFAKETVSPYSGHLHLHLGRAQKGMFRDIDYPDVPLLVDIDLVRNMAREKGVSPESLVEDGIVEEMKNPICVIKNRKYPTHVSLILNLKGPDGRFFVLNAIRADKIDRDCAGIKLAHLSNISVRGLMTMLSYEDNLVYVRRSMENRFSSDIVDVLRASGDKKGGPEYPVPHGSNGEYREGLYHDDQDDVLNVVAKIVNNFKNPKNFEDLDKKIADAVREAAPAPSIPAKGEAPEKETVAFREPSPVVETPAVPQSEALKNLSRPVAEGGFSKVTLKKFADKGVVTAGDIRSRMSMNDGGERFAADFGKKAYRDAMRWMDVLGVSSLRMVSRQKVSEGTTGQQGHPLAVLDFFRALREFPKDTLPGQVVMPAAADGRLFSGADAYQLAARIAANTRWGGCNMFLTQDDMAAFDLSPLPSAEPVHLISGGGRQVWNLMDLDVAGDMKEALARRYRDLTPAVPAPMIRQLATYAPSSRDDVPSIAEHLAKRFDDMSGMAAGAAVPSLETAVKDEVSAIEKKYDPTGVLRGHLFPPADIYKLCFRGTAHVQAEVTRRPMMEYDRVPAVAAKQKVAVTLRLEDGGIAVYAHDGKRIPGKLRDLLRGEDRRLRPAPRKAAAGIRNTETNTIKKNK